MKTWTPINVFRDMLSNTTVAVYEHKTVYVVVLEVERPEDGKGGGGQGKNERGENAGEVLAPVRRREKIAFFAQPLDQFLEDNHLANPRPNAQQNADGEEKPGRPEHPRVDDMPPGELVVQAYRNGKRADVQGDHQVEHAEHRRVASFRQFFQQVKSFLRSHAVHFTTPAAKQAGNQGRAS